jgi:hypothetical protein
MNDIAWLLPFLFQAGAQPVSQPPAPDKSLPMMSTRYAQAISVSGLPGEMMPLSGKQFGLVWADGPRRNPHTRHGSGGTGHCAKAPRNSEFSLLTANLVEPVGCRGTSNLLCDPPIAERRPRPLPRSRFPPGRGRPLAFEIRLRAERRIGEMIRAQRAAGLLAEPWAPLRSPRRSKSTATASTVCSGEPPPSGVPQAPSRQPARPT